MIDELRDKNAVTQWAELCQNKLSENNKHDSYQVTVTEDETQHCFLPIITQVSHGLQHITSLSADFFRSKEYASIADLSNNVRSLLDDGAYVERKEQKHPVKYFIEALNWLTQQTKKGLNIQRYKGLGEMNPDQLWDTTMNPETRRLLKVTIEDAVAADQIFTTLMGDQVEPRRAFIEDNALLVSNLDV